MRELHGILVVDKPAAMTSAAVVAEVRRALRPLGVKKAGHTGTLDPLATGVLPLCFGEATKLATYLLVDEKAYEAELVLGVETDTLDAYGREVARDDAGAALVTEAMLRAALGRFTGAIEQVPPMYSAIQQDGRRLHELAREGVDVDRAARAVTIHRLELLGFDPVARRARIEVDCSKGTYVRTLVADLGRAVGCGAHLGALRRTRSGRFTLADAAPYNDVLRRDPAALARIVSPARTLGLPEVVVAPAHHRKIFEGHVPPEVAADLAAARAKSPESEMIQLVNEVGDLVAIVAMGGDRPTYARVFTYGLTLDTRSSKVPPST
jgi:tRNA pseudouridine55 synthase